MAVSRRSGPVDAGLATIQAVGCFIPAISVTIAY